MGRTTEEALKIIKQAENEIIRIDTQSESALKTLEEKYGISSLDEGDSMLDKWKDEVEALEKEQITKQKYLEENFPWE